MYPIDAILSSPILWLALSGMSLGTFLLFLASRYEKVGPNEVLIVSGRESAFTSPDGQSVRKNFRIYHGGGTFVWPVRERVDRLNLELMTLEIKTPEFHTKFGVPIIVDGIAQIKVRSDDPLALITAAEMFLSKNVTEMNDTALQMMSGHLRAVISTLPFEEIHMNPEAFAQTVQRLTAEDLANMGIQVISFTIREIQDPKGYLQAIGRPKMAEVQKNAVIGEAAATRDSAMGKALADREATITQAKATEDSSLARIHADVAIAEAAKDKGIKVHAFDAEVATAKAQSDMAYELQKAKTQQLLTDEQLGVSLIEKRKMIELTQFDIQRAELQLVQNVQKPAEAEAFRIERLAQAEQLRHRAIGQANADAVRMRGMAEAEVMRARGDAEAEAVRKRGLAEAEGLRARYLAEAEGMQEKAKAWQGYNEAALSQMLVERLPEIAAAIAAPLARIDRITLVNSGSGNGDGLGVERITRGVTDVMGQIPGAIEMLSGINLPDLLKRLPAIGASSTGAAPAPAQGPEPDPELSPEDVDRNAA